MWQVEAELQSVSATFARLHGRGEVALDLYGRGTAPSGGGVDKTEHYTRQLSSGQRKSKLR